MASNQDIEFTIQIEEPTYSISIDNLEYNINIDDTPTYSINLAEVGPIGPQGIQGEKGEQGDKGDTGNGISNISKIEEETNYSIYRIEFTDGGIYDYTVYNGSSIESIEKTSTVGLVDTYTITLTNGETSTFAVTNGEKGEQGETGNGISSIQLISTVGLTKTYRITYTNGNTFDYEVKDGACSQTYWGDISGTLSNQTDLQDKFDTIDDKIKDIELFKFPNAVIVGEPTIQSGQVSGFSTSNYLQFPFVVDVRNKNFEIDFCFTTSSDVTTQQNILDSNFGLALAIYNGKGIMAMSSNGTNWDIGITTGTYTISANTTYYAKVSWNGTTYATALSTDGETYTTDMTLTSSLGLYPTTIYIGGGTSDSLGHTPTPFNGTINFNKCYLYVAGLLVWQGMDDAGLATRADVSLSNLDSLGEAKFTAKQNVIDDLDTIRTNATNGNTAYTTIQGYGDIVTHNASEFLVPSSLTTLLETLFPVGAIYQGNMAECPLATLIPNSTWTLVASDKVLQGAGDRGTIGSTIAQSLPNIIGNLKSNIVGANGVNSDGAFKVTGYSASRSMSSGSGWDNPTAQFNASWSSSIYQDGANVQMDAYVVNIWERTA